MRKAIFLDKDGTLIPDIPYNVDPSKITLQPQMIEGLRLLSEQDYLLIIVSNQAGVARGYFTEAQLKLAMEQLRKLLSEVGIAIDDVYYCPHLPDATVPEYKKICICRKPLPGLLLRAAQEHGIDLSYSWMIGDILNDVEAGNRAGCRSILIDNGNETEWQAGKFRRPAFSCNCVNEAAIHIYNQDF
jgi:D-glycero-D-manno-heptose 1,7-bisphosphate phosphatase